ncbi:MAG: porin family protein [Chitinophagaceae bacterium]
MKRIFLLAILASVTIISNAQVQFGAKASFNFSNVSVSPKDAGESYKFTPGFNVGGLAAIGLTENFTLQPEVLFSMQGSKGKYTDGSTTVNSTLSLGYINIPVLAKYKTSSGFFAEVGPQLGFLVTAKQKTSGTSTDVKQYFKSTDFSGVLGVGYLSSMNLGVDLRYNLGFTNIAKDANGSVKNGVFQLGVFYLFGGAKK